MIYNDFEDEDDGEEEALSLCDLPTFDDSKNPSSRNESPPKAIESQEEEEFNFCDHQSLNETELCAADDVFFQGQIVPFAIKQKEGIISSNGEAIYHSCSSEFTSESSRSSSLHSSSSLNSTSTTTIEFENKLPEAPVLNQFQFSQPSPKPHLRNHSTATKNGYFSSNPKSNSRSGSWTLFRVGLVTTPEIGIQDLKVRSNCKNETTKKKKKKKKGGSFFNKKGPLFSSCKCSAVNSASIVMKEEHHHHHQGKDKEEKDKQSRHRTFEWLKQLSLETATDE